MTARTQRSGHRLGVILAAVALTACTAEEPNAHHAALDEVAPAPILDDAPTVAPPAPDEDARRSDDVSHSSEALRAVPFPVLLLPERFREGAVITSGTVWYAMSYDRPRDVNVAIHATNQVHMTLEDEELPPPNAEVRGVPAHTGVNEGIRSITWEDAEVAYVVEVECWNVFEDPRCTEPDFARQIAEDLVELPR